jgi:predicted alpha/beta-hydrolase family hydrolase
MLPGFGGTADQPILVELEAALADRGLRALRASLPAGRPSPGLGREVDLARALGRSDPAIVAYAGRSFGGRVLARLALEVPPRALVLLGFPVRSQTGIRRLDDEAVLQRLRCPTLVVQGARDPLGPVRTLSRLATTNSSLLLEVIPGATHTFGQGQRRAVATAADWLARVLGAREPSGAR